ncbi:HAD family hydrolase, partial [Candidatus Saccharibacteria bacterium]|nr:HAD family hydrolase [Candidatus Saccharibacteria bacterium]
HGSLSNTLINVLSLDDQELDSVMSVFLDIQDKLYSQDLKGYLFDDTLRLMMEASRLGIRQTIVTNRGHLGRGSASPIVIAKKLGIDQYIDQIIPGDQTEYRKPDIRVLGNLTNDMMSDNILVIGDQIVDIEFAINLGAKSILVDR